jgi:hypothetical protein
MTRPITDKLPRETPISSDQLLRRLISYLGAILPCHARSAFAVCGTRHTRCRMASSQRAVVRILSARRQRGEASCRIDVRCATSIS